MMYILLPLWSLPPKAAVPLAPPPNYTYLLTPWSRVLLEFLGSYPVFS